MEKFYLMCYIKFGDIMLIDTHCHISKEYYENIPSIIEEMNGIMISVFIR